MRKGGFDWESSIMASTVLGMLVTLFAIYTLDFSQQHQVQSYSFLQVLVDQQGMSKVFILAFLGSTVIPFPVDAFFASVYKISQNGWMVFFVVLTANVLGSCLNYGMALMLRKGWVKGQVDKKTLRKLTRWFSDYGPLSLFVLGAAPIPLFDPITFVAGLARMDFKNFVVYVTVSRALHFALFALLVLGI